MKEMKQRVRAMMTIVLCIQTLIYCASSIGLAQETPSAELDSRVADVASEEKDHGRERAAEETLTSGQSLAIIRKSNMLYDVGVGFAGLRGEEYTAFATLLQFGKRIQDDVEELVKSRDTAPAGAFMAQLSGGILTRFVPK